jgi:hypothetical protein
MRLAPVHSFLGVLEELHQRVLQINIRSLVGVVSRWILKIQVFSEEMDFDLLKYSTATSRNFFSRGRATSL